MISAFSLNSWNRRKNHQCLFDTAHDNLLVIDSDGTWAKIMEDYRDEMLSSAERSDLSVPLSTCVIFMHTCG